MAEDLGLGAALDFLTGLDAEGDRFNELSKALVNNLFVLLRSAGIYDLNNEAMNRPYASMQDAVNDSIELFGEEIALQLVDGNFFVNRRLVRLDYSTFENVRYLRRIFEFLDVNEMRFMQAIDRRVLSRLLVAFLDVVQDGGSHITDHNLEPIRLRKLVAGEEDERAMDQEPRERVLHIYASGLLMLRAFVNDLRRGRAPRHAKVKRLCLELIDIRPRFHNLLISLVHLEAYKGNLFCHMLNTAVMSIVFGHRLGLSKRQLVDLGMAAFHHDLGWALVGTLESETDDPTAPLSMAGINNQREHSAEMMDELRVKVARALVRLGGFNELVINRLIVAYECQIPEDAPPVGLYYGEIGASFMTHVVRMSSAYDELTTSRVRRQALLPDQAMQLILDDDGSTYDVFLAKLFANCLGAYPVGSLVELDTTEIALVVNLPSNPINFHRPQVKILIDREGETQADGAMVDLDVTYRGGGRYMRTIERGLDSRTFGLSITRFFFG